MSSRKNQVGHAKSEEIVPLEDTDLNTLFSEAYYSFDPAKELNFDVRVFEEKVTECGKNKDKRLVVMETPNYVNVAGAVYWPTEQKYKGMLKWLQRRKLDATYELSHSSLNFWTGNKTLQIVVYFHPKVAPDTVK
jgi:hypothetical protein